MTDGEPMQFLFSNFTKASGYFYDSHTTLRHRFITKQIDSRTAAMTNNVEIAKWIEDYGLDSDYVKVRVLGEPPSASDKQFVATPLVTAAMDPLRQPVANLIDAVIIGVDVARFGSDESAIVVRRGRDARSEPMLTFRNLDLTQLSYRVKSLADRLLPDAINVDGGGGFGGAVIDNLRNWNVQNVNEVHFGSTITPDNDYYDMASYMLGQIRDWLKQDGTCLQNDPVLKRQLITREYKMVEGKRGTAIKIESKDEMRAHVDKKESPDRSDALGLTFAVPVGPRNIEKTRAALTGEAYSNVVGADYDR
jgi:hypothetical protein